MKYEIGSLESKSLSKSVIFPSNDNDFSFMNAKKLSIAFGRTFNECGGNFSIFLQIFSTKTNSFPSKDCSFP